MPQSQDAAGDSVPIRAVAGSPSQAAKYWSCSHEELIELQIEAWALGASCAKSDVPHALRDLTAIEQRAESACEEALLTYVPIELARFHDVYTLAWVGGYCAAARGAGGANSAGAFRGLG